MNSQIGVIGLGVMGRNLAGNMLEKGHAVSVYNRTIEGEEEVLSSFMEKYADHPKLEGFAEIDAFLGSLETPRIVLLMIKAGTAVDDVLNVLLPKMSKGDNIIDGGNSNYQHTNRRFNQLRKVGIHFLGCGISGGEEGALKGPAIMPGGDSDAYQIVSPILESIAAKDKNGQPCCAYIGKSGAGHFVKMVHNGMEYAEMQLIAESYHMLSQSMTNAHISEIFSKWNDDDLGSYLLEITIDILDKKADDGYLLDKILDVSANKGTGSWTSQVALQLGLPTTMITEAVFTRYISTEKNRRVKLSDMKSRKDQESMVSAELLEDGYRLARIINHHQGFELIKCASAHFHWDVNLSEVARIWTNGCIIRSKLIEDCIQILQNHETILDDPAVAKDVCSLENQAIDLVPKAMSLGIATPVFSSAIQFWLSMTTKKSPANLIQAQRDYFGAHTYRRSDDPSGAAHHTDWKE